jgi:universal stress protein A
MSYAHILCAVDLTDDSPRIVARAQALAASTKAKLTLMHVVEYIPVDPAGEALLPPPIEVERDLVAGATKRLDALADSTGVAAGARLVVVGSIKGEIVKVATERGCDLVVLGARGRHGLGALLASTEKSVLVHAPCDVLAVRIG